MNKTQKGFALIESLLIVLILVIIGFGGYYVWHSQQQTDKTNNDSVKASQSTPSPSASSSSSQKYLAIAEYGVKFQLSSAISDAYYTKADNGYIYLSVHRFDDLAGAEGCRASGISSNGLVALIAAKVGDDTGAPAGGTWTQAGLDSSGLKKVGDTYYGFQRGNGNCYDPDNPPQPGFQQTIADIISAFDAQIQTFTKT